MNSLSFSLQNLVNVEPIEWPLNSVFTNKYCKIRYWLRNYEYLREFTNSLMPIFANMQLFVNIRSTLNIYWLFSIWIRWQQIQTNGYSVTFDYLYYTVRYSMSNNKGNFELFDATYKQYLHTVCTLCIHNTVNVHMHKHINTSFCIYVCVSVLCMNTRKRM